MPSTSPPRAGPPAPGDVWSAGDYGAIADFQNAVESAGLVRFAGVRTGQAVLDVGTGSGTVALVAAQRGAKVTGLDPAASLLATAKRNAAIAGLDDVEWKEGVVESLPYSDARFDVVLSQFAHMFSPQPEQALQEMLRVLKPGGTLAFACWKPGSAAEQLFAVGRKHGPPMPGPPPPSPMLWGDEAAVRQRLGSGVKEVAFQPDALRMPTLSIPHFRLLFERNFPPTVLLTQHLKQDPAKLEAWRRDHDAALAPYFQDNVLRFDYLRTRATKG